MRGVVRWMRCVVGLAAVCLLAGVGSGPAWGLPTEQGPAASASEATPVVFVHGNGDDAAKWIGIIGLFESNGYPRNRLAAIRFTYPSARTDDTREEPARSSTEDATAELSAFVTRVLIETHSKKVALVGSSRGGMTIRNYLEHGGAANVSYAVLCGTPNHGVSATDTNLNGEFNGRGPYLQALNHTAEAGALETVAGVRMMTLRSDSLDKYAQPTGVGLGAPQVKTNVTYEGPALLGATNVVLAGFDHRELAFQPRAFAEMYRFITGKAPARLTLQPEAAPVVSGLVTGFAGAVPTNLGVAGVQLRIIPSGAPSTAPIYETTTGADGHWGPVTLAAGQQYQFELTSNGRVVRYYKAPIVRSTSLLNLRLLPVPKEAATLPSGRYVLVERVQAYLTRERDPILIDGRPAQDEPSGLPSGVPVRDSFVAAVPEVEGMAKVTLRDETIVAAGSRNLGNDLPVVDFLW